MSDDDVAITVLSPGLGDTGRSGGFVTLRSDLLRRLLRAVRDRYPQKSFGYLLSDDSHWDPTDFILFERNIRNDSAWRDQFESYGRYFVDHNDAGFVASPEESWEVHREITRRGLFEVGILHTHLRHPANFSRIDYEMHLKLCPSLWHLIISLRNPSYSRLRVFEASDAGVRELGLIVEDDSAPRTQERERRARRRQIDHGAVEIAEPIVKDVARMVRRLEEQHLHRNGDYALPAFLADLGDGCDNRFDEHIAPLMISLEGGRFEMGTFEREAAHYCGETPRHTVELSPYAITSVPITNELYALFGEQRRDVNRNERSLPVVGVTWIEAMLFALWVGCSLPTEAEWEFACGAGSSDLWCCGDESNLSRYAWYSESSDGVLHDVGTREPNSFGLLDLHGNVWEWCADTYTADFYAHSPQADPLNLSAATDTRAPAKVCRGGSMHALAEMCRTGYRQHEPADFSASDLGFRLVHRTRPLFVSSGEK